VNLEPEADAALKFMEDRAAGLSLRTKLIAAACVLALLGLAAFAYWPAKPIHEEVKATPQARHDDGSVTAAQAPDAYPPAPKMVLPRGSVRERAGKIVAHQAPGASSVEIDTEFVRIGNRRELHVTSPDGTIDTAVDIPITPELIPPPPRKWAAGLSYSTEREVGIWIERDVGRLRFGAEVAKGVGKPRAEIRAGVAF
jgi:hypothetical protein